MNGRLEHKIEIENRLKYKIKNMPEYMQRYFYYINSNTHNTKERYIENVLRFLNYFGEGEIVEQDRLRGINSFVIQKYISDISYYEKNGEVKELSDTSKANIYSYLSSFMAFLYGNGYIDTNPLNNGSIKRPKPQETEVKYLTPQEVKKVERSILNGIGTERSKARTEKWRYRDFCLFWLPVSNGIRVGALSEINVGDIDFKDMSIRGIEKGNKPVRIHLNEKAVMYLRLWIEQRNKILNGQKIDALFISERKKRMDVSSIEKTIIKYTEASIARHISPHKLRATFATNLYKKTGNIELVSKACHHSSTVPTERYVAVLDRDIKDAVNLNLYD